MRVRTGHVLMFLLVLFFFCVQQNGCAEEDISVDHIHIPEKDLILVSLQVSSFELIEQNDETTVVDVPGFDQLNAIGFPRIPVRTVLIGLPPNSQLSQVSLLSDQDRKIPGWYQLAEATSIANDSLFFPLVSEEKRIDSSSFFPAQPFEIVGMQHIEGICAIEIRFYPFSYHQDDGMLSVHEKIVLSLTYESQVDSSWSSTDHDHRDHLASSMLMNYDQIASLYQNKITFSDESVPLVIITTVPCEDRVVFLKNWREMTLGESVRVVNISWIKSTYAGEDTAEKIKAFLLEKYDQWQLEYVLFVGSHTYLPMRACYPDPSDHSSSKETLTDLYYADLTGEWDADDDGFFGERGDDSPDFYPELYVGRIPVDDPSMVEQICQKTISFESRDDSWKQRALLLGAMLYYDNEGGNQDIQKTDGSRLMESMNQAIFEYEDYQVTRLYETEGMSPSPFDSDDGLSAESVLKYWPDGYGMVNWNAHGNAWAAQRKVWSVDDGDGVPESSELDHLDFFSSFETSFLDDDRPSFVFSCACRNADPFEDQNLGVSLLKHGAVGFVGGTTTTWSSVGWDSLDDGGIQSINHLFMSRFIQQQYPCAMALADTLYEYSVNYDWWEWMSYQNLYAFTLYADPLLSMKPYQVSSPMVPQLPQGPFICQLGSIEQFSTQAVDETNQLWYQWDYGDGSVSPWIGPFQSGEQVTVEYSWNTVGSYQLRVKMRNGFGLMSKWSDPLQVTVAGPHLEIESIQGGIGVVRVTIENSGNTAAYQVQCNIEVETLFRSKQKEQIIEVIPAQQNMVVNSMFMFGFARMTVEVSLPEYGLEEKTYALLIGPFVLIS